MNEVSITRKFLESMESTREYADVKPKNRVFEYILFFVYLLVLDLVLLSRHRNDKRVGVIILVPLWRTARSRGWRLHPVGQVCDVTCSVEDEMRPFAPLQQHRVSICIVHLV